VPSIFSSLSERFQKGFVDLRPLENGKHAFYTRSCNRVRQPPAKRLSRGLAQTIGHFGVWRGDSSQPALLRVQVLVDTYGQEHVSKCTREPLSRRSGPKSGEAKPCAEKTIWEKPPAVVTDRLIQVSPTHSHSYFQFPNSKWKQRFRRLV